MISKFRDVRKGECPTDDDFAVLVLYKDPTNSAFFIALDRVWKNDQKGVMCEFWTDDVSSVPVEDAPKWIPWKEYATESVSVIARSEDPDHKIPRLRDIRKGEMPDCGDHYEVMAFTEYGEPTCFAYLWGDKWENDCGIAAFTVYPLWVPIKELFDFLKNPITKGNNHD